jgi:hypothetical protein
MTIIILVISTNPIYYYFSSYTFISSYLVYFVRSTSIFMLQVVLLVGQRGAPFSTDFAVFTNE